MKTFLPLTVLALAVATPLAHAKDCRIDIDYGVTLESRQVLLQDGNTVYVLSDGELRKDGKSIALSGSEKQQVRRYEAGLRELVPQISAITRDALAIAGEATDFAFSRLLGPDHESVKALRGKFASLGDEIGKRMDDRHLPAKPMSLRDKDWDVVGDGAAISWNVAEASFALMGKAMRAAFDEEYGKQWQADLDQMEKELDAKVDARAKQLERKAEAACTTLRELDGIEQALSRSNSALKAFDVVREPTEN